MERFGPKPAPINYTGFGFQPQLKSLDSSLWGSILFCHPISDLFGVALSVKNPNLWEMAIDQIPVTCTFVFQC